LGAEKQPRQERHPVIEGESHIYRRFHNYNHHSKGFGLQHGPAIPAFVANTATPGVDSKPYRLYGQIQQPGLHTDASLNLKRQQMVDRRTRLYGQRSPDEAQPFVYKCQFRLYPLPPKKVSKRVTTVILQTGSM
jgi:hypothetical protein